MSSQRIFGDLNRVGVVKEAGSQCFIGPVFTSFDPPTCEIIVKRK